MGMKLMSIGVGERQSVSSLVQSKWALLSPRLWNIAACFYYFTAKRVYKGFINTGSDRTTADAKRELRYALVSPSSVHSGD